MSTRCINLNIYLRDTVMKTQNIILALILSTVTVTAVAVSTEQEKDVKSVAWYTANVRAARAQNKICFDDPSLQESTTCKNTLHALKMVYVGVGN